MKKILILALIGQTALLGYFSINAFSEKHADSNIEITVSIEIPEFGNETVLIEPPPLPVETADPFDFDIPKRRLATQNKNNRIITLDKNINVLGTMGEAMMENPLFMRGIEKAIRRLFAEFYADFVKEADLSPEEQIELFKMMSSTMQDNIKSLMNSMGDNMGDMQEMFRGKSSPELIEGIKDNNLAMKEGFIATLGEERFKLFEQYHKEKSAAESFTRFKQSLKYSKSPMTSEQENDMREVFLDQQQSPFEESTYSNNERAPVTNSTSEILNEKQQKTLKNSRKRQNRILLLPF